MGLFQSLGRCCTYGPACSCDLAGGVLEVSVGVCFFPLAAASFSSCAAHVYLVYAAAVANFYCSACEARAVSILDNLSLALSLQMEGRPSTYTLTRVRPDVACSNWFLPCLT